MEKPAKMKRAKRKLRSTEEFNHIDRKSAVVNTSQKSDSKKKVLKRKKPVFNLPPTNFEFDIKENHSPNAQIQKLKGKSQDDLIEETHFDEINTDDKLILKSTSTSVDEDKRDSEVEFKKKRRKRKKKKMSSSSSSIYLITPNSSLDRSNTNVSSQIDSNESDTANHEKRSTFEKKESIFDIADLPIIEADSKEYEDDNSRKSLNTTVNLSKIRHSKITDTNSSLRESKVVKTPVKDEFEILIGSRASTAKKSRVSRLSKVQETYTSIRKSAGVIADNDKIFLDNVENSTKRSRTDVIPKKSIDHTTFPRKSVRASPILRLKQSDISMKKSIGILKTPPMNKARVSSNRSTTKKSVASVNPELSDSSIVFDSVEESGSPRKSVDYSPNNFKSRVSKNLDTVSTTEESSTYISPVKSDTDSEFMDNILTTVKKSGGPRKSVRFNSTEIGLQSPCNISTNYPKSPHVKKISNVVSQRPSLKRRSKSLELTNPVRESTSSNQRRSRTDSVDISSKKSVSFLSPKDKKSITSKIYSKSPYVDMKRISNTEGIRSSMKRRSRSLDISDYDKENPSPNKRRSKNASFDILSKKSVSFITPKNKKSSTSKIYSKSPYVDLKRISNTENIRPSMKRRSNSLNTTFDISEDSSFLKKRASKSFSTHIADKKSVSVITPRKSSSIILSTSKRRSKSLDKTSTTPQQDCQLRDKRKSRSYSTDVSDKKSVSFMTPKNKSPKTSKVYSKSPFVHTFLSVEDKTNTTFDKSPATTRQSLRNKRSSEKSTTLSNFSGAENIKEQQVLKVTLRKKWNKSLGASDFDDSGILQSISPPWDMNFTAGDSVSSGLSHENTAKYNSPLLKYVQESSGSRLEIPAALGKVEDSSTSNVQNNNSFNISKALKKTNANKKLKMPNFALIHQRAYDKLENIKEMSERKALRAQYLLSGKKPNADMDAGSSLKTAPSKVTIKSPKSRRLLKYSPKLVKSQAPAPKVPLIKNKLLTPSSSNPKVVAKAPMVAKIVKPVIMPSSSNSKGPSVTKPTTSFIPQPKVMKPIEKKIAAKTNIPKLVTQKPVAAEKKLSKLDKVTRQEQIKAVATKTRGGRNSIEERRNAVHNVRGNRRFELLMKMRKGKL